jgi:hypothetical protein
MPVLYIGDINKYKDVRYHFDNWSNDISSREFNSEFEDYWNRRVTSPKFTYDIVRVKVIINEDKEYYPPITLEFTNDEEKSWWILKNS